MRSLGKHTLAGTEQGDGGWHAVVGWVMPYADGEDEQDAEEGEAVDAGQRRHVVLKHHHLRRRRGEREGVGERSKRSVSGISKSITSSLHRQGVCGGMMSMSACR